MPTFLGLDQGEGDVDVAILSLPYELTTSYGQGTALGPMACIEASTQVELYDAQLGQDLPAGLSMRTIQPWNGEEPTLLEQLDSMAGYLIPWFRGDCFPLCLGGEHGILPPIMEAARHHPLVDNDLSNLTVVQIDAHGISVNIWTARSIRTLVPQHEPLMLELVRYFRWAFAPTAKRNTSV